MELFDSQGKVVPIGAPDQGLVTRKVSDKNGQRHGTPKAKKPRDLPAPPSEEEPRADGDNHLIDIMV